MNRLLLLLTTCLVASMAACGDSNQGVKILVFQASPDAIEAGQSTTLVFAVDPPDAKVAITGIGDLTGQSKTTVTPTATTSYQLTVDNGHATANQTVTVTVGATSASAIKVDPATATPGAGDQIDVTLTVLASNGKPAPGFRGTVHVTSTDAKAILPADVAFTAADMGVKHVKVTLETAGLSTLTATDTTSKAGIQGSASVTVQPGAAKAFALTALPASATAGQSLVLSITVKDTFGNVVTGFAGQARLASTDATDVLPPAGGFSNGVRTVSVAFTKSGSHLAQVQDVASAIPSTNTTTVVVGAGPPVRIGVTTVNSATTAGAAEPLMTRVLDVFDNVVIGYVGTVHFAATDANAVVPADFTFTALDAGTHAFNVTLKTAGSTTVTVNDTVTPAVKGAADWTVQPAGASLYRLTTLPASASAGQALVLTITVMDGFGNIVSTYPGQTQLTSADPTDVLPPVGGFINGVRTLSVEFTKAGSHTATVTDVAGVVAPTSTSSVDVVAGPPSRVAVTTLNATSVAGSSEPVTTKIVDFFNNTVLSYTGTVHFAIDDPKAVLPADFTFTAGDAGAHAFNVTLKTSGHTNLAISDTVNAGVSGAATWTVGSAAATTCVASQAPTTAIAGTVLGLTVAVRDTFGNAATDYTGTVRLTASDARANLPTDVTYVPASDAGRHAFSVALLTTGSQTVTATDTTNPAIQCIAGIAITPAAPKLVLSVPGSANAGYPVNVGVAVKDLFDNAIPAYTGKVSFTSTDGGAGAATPAPITFTGSEGGVATTTVTFITPGTQTLSAKDAGAPQASGTTAAAVHGLVYTGPSSGRVRLVANAAASNPQIVQLDLVANERLEVSTFFGGGPGSFAAGMNLPLDTTRVGADTTLFTPGPALPAGPGTRAALGRIGPDHVLYTAVSRKRVAGSIFGQETEVQIGQVFYSVRLKLTQAGSVGPVFDGAQPLAMYRAAVRDQWGDDFVSQSDIGVGKLEVR